MKRLPFALAFLFAVVLPSAAQDQVRQRLSTDRGTQTQDSPPVTRSRIIANTLPANQVRNESVVPSASESQISTSPAWGDADVQIEVNPSSPPLAISVTASPKPRSNTTTTAALVKRTGLNIENVPSNANLRPAVTATSVYRVGAGDVLDIRLANMTTRESTLFTVMKNGVLEYPLIVNPIPVVGLTPDEIARRLNSEIKVIQNPRAIVIVRDYASHAVMITGAVDNPGRKMLRREAVPLFTVLAEALPRSDAVTAVVLRNGKEITLSLTRGQDLSSLIVAGDAIRVLVTVRQFVYVGGDVAAAGEKELREGMTLTQLLIAAGGVHGEGQSKAKVTRREPGGLLKSEDYSVSAIEAGEAPDPVLQPGDRIEVKRSM